MSKFENWLIFEELKLLDLARLRRLIEKVDDLFVNGCTCSSNNSSNGLSDKDEDGVSCKTFDDW